MCASTNQLTFSPFQLDEQKDDNDDAPAKEASDLQVPEPLGAQQVIHQELPGGGRRFGDIVYKQGRE